MTDHCRTEWSGREGRSDTANDLVVALLCEYSHTAIQHRPQPERLPPRSATPRCILDLFARIVNVSIETNEIVDALPPLDILEKV